MSVQSEITRLENAKAAIKAAIEGKGVTVPEATLLDGMAALIESIEAAGNVKIGNFSTFNYGSFQLAEDVSTYTIDLGYKGGESAPVVEQFFLSRDMTSTFSGTSTKNSLVVAAYLRNVSSAATSTLSVRVARYYNSSGSISTSTVDICKFNDVSNNSTPRTMTVYASNANSSCVLTSGATYNWIVLRREE